MSTAFQWEEVEVPRGAYMSWGNTAGQSITGKALSYDETGGTDANDKVCPQLQLELVENTYAENKLGEKSPLTAGELVVLNCGLVSLKRAVRAAAIDPGDIVKIELTNITPLPGNKTVKEFGIKIARGAGRSAAPAAQPAPAVAAAPAPAADDTPPAGFDPATWAGMDASLKATIRAAQQ